MSIYLRGNNQNTSVLMCNTKRAAVLNLLNLHLYIRF